MNERMDGDETSAARGRRKHIGLGLTLALGLGAAGCESARAGDDAQDPPPRSVTYDWPGSLQPGGGERGPRGPVRERPVDRDGRGSGRGEGRSKRPESGPEVEAWAAVLIEHLTHRDDRVRDSARAALAALGPAAAPLLERVAAGDDVARAEAARRVLHHIHEGPRHRGPMGRGEGPEGHRGGAEGHHGGPMGRPGGPPDGAPRGGHERGDGPPMGPPPQDRFRGPDDGKRGPGPGGPHRPDGPRGPRGGEESARPRGPSDPMAEALARLDLDEALRERVEVVLREHRDAHRKRMEERHAAGGNPPSEEAVRAEREKARAALMESLKTVLGEEKFLRFQEGFPKPRSERQSPESR